MNIFACVAMAGVAYMGVVHGVYRSFQTLAACVLAGVVALGLFGPATALLPAGDPKSIWYFAADPFCLWAIFCAAFLALRTLAEKLLKNEPELPYLVDRAGGAVFGAATGYLAAGMCALLVQMLPTSPDLLGYEAFRHRAAEDGRPEAGEPARPERVEAGRSLWLVWDRGTLAFFGYLLSQPLGSDDAGLFSRYGDLYPPAEQRGEGYQPAVDAADVLYYYWYRRYEFILWQTGEAGGPIPPEAARGPQGGPGLALAVGQAGTQSEVNLRIIRLERLAALAAFAQERPGAGEEFVLVTLRFRPAGRMPKTVDSSQFFLLGTRGERYTGPLVLGRAKAAQPEPQILPDFAMPSVPAFRAARFNMPAGRQEGHFLASGAAFTFTDPEQQEVRTLVFAVPKQMTNEMLRLNVLAAPAPGPASPAAVPPAAMPKPGAAPSPGKAAPPAAPAPPAPAKPAASPAAAAPQAAPAK